MKSILILGLAFGAATITSTEKKVDVENSKITWKGHKVTGEHEGTLQLKEGALNFDGDKLSGGTFVMDMTSLTVTDLEGDMNGKLTGHLKSEDFFGIEKHPTATFKITNVEKGKENMYKVTGDMTIKDITNPITFDMEVNENSALADVKIDRTKFDIKYRSSSFFDGLKDKAIYDDFDLNVNLKF